MSLFSRCAVCDRMLLPGAEEQRSVCEDCARKAGAIAMPPPRRRATPCTKCNHTKLVRVIPRELVDDFAGPMFAAYRFLRWQDHAARPIDPRAGYGVLEAYICKQCGFVEWYCRAPEAIPIGPEYMTEDIDLDAGPPYR